MPKTNSRRTFMKTMAVAIGSLAIPLALSPLNSMAVQTNSNGGKILIVSFSHSGNTRHMAKLIHSRLGGDQLEIKTVKPYPLDHDAVVAQARKEQDDDFRPILKNITIDPTTYEHIFVAYPNWWGTMPMALFTFFETYDFSGKSIYAFSTHEGSGFGQTISDLKRLNPHSTIVKGLAVRGRSIRNQDIHDDIYKSLNKLDV